MIVVEGVLRMVAPPGGEITAEDVVSLVVRLREEAGVPIRWVTTDLPRSQAALRRLHERRILTGVQSVVADGRPYEEMKSAIYQRRITLYDYPPLITQLTALSLADVRSDGVAVADPPLRGREVTEAPHLPARSYRPHP